MLLADLVERVGPAGVVTYADVFEAVDETGELLIVQYRLGSRSVLFAAGHEQEGYPSLDECVLDGLARLGW
ncbi:hypothetical protein SK803_20080 [Lentzea sp. BCCO 10_0856]|uniref:Uncharacterized protein n=1 Tax=Lentzea miocenica TaxID=3095431 RepID=A0ABU4T2Z1_9PSEU|nr:hypothetical protein [Lentzea sp. BCCO 10_0856]MDX8032518.1 hypothetical protein [Lentzea sp. BCCO 10_0856]